MALLTCKDCAKQFSNDAKRCPSCGAKPPRNTSPATKIVAVVMGIGIVSGIALSSRVPNTPAVASAPIKITDRHPGTAVALMRQKVDPIEKITWYEDKTTTPFNNVNSAHLYISDDGRKPWLHFRLQYAGEKWLFIQSATIVIDGKKAGEVSGSWKRDNNSTVWEWSDVPIDSDNVALVRQLAGATKATIRYSGQQYIRDRDIPASELKAMRNVLAAYKELGGDM